MRKIKIIPEIRSDFIKNITMYALVFVMGAGHLHGQQTDDVTREIVERIGKKKEWNVSSEPKLMQNGELSGIKGEVTDHLKRFDIRKVQEFAFSFSRDSSQYLLDLISFPSQIRAFALYSVEKSPQLDYHDIGFEAYQYGNKYVSWYGIYVISAESRDTLAEAEDRLGELMKEVIKILPEQKKKTPVLDCLPGRNRVEHSEKYYASHWLGQDYFKNIYYADYYIPEGYSRIFIINNRNTAAADSNFWNYYAIIRQNAGVLNDSLKIDTDYFVINEPLWGKAVLAKKNQIIYGVLDFRNVEWTEERLAELLEELKDKKIVKPG